MYRFLRKFIVAYLVLLGDSAFAAEYRYENENGNTANSYSNQLTLSTQLEKVSISSPSSCSALLVQHSKQCANVFCSLYALISSTIPNQLNNSLFSPRAPPVA